MNLQESRMTAADPVLVTSARLLRSESVRQRAVCLVPEGRDRFAIVPSLGIAVVVATPFICAGDQRHARGGWRGVETKKKRDGSTPDRMP